MEINNQEREEAKIIEDFGIRHTMWDIMKLTEFIKILKDNKWLSSSFVNIQDQDGNTALMYASEHSNKNSTEGTVKMLLDAGANPDIQICEYSR